MDREPTAAEKVLAEAMSFVCVFVLVGCTLFGLVLGLGRIDSNLGNAAGVLCIGVLFFQQYFSRPSLLNRLGTYLTHFFARLIVSKGR